MPPCSRKGPPCSPACINTRGNSKSTNPIPNMPACVAYGRTRLRTAWWAIALKPAREDRDIEVVCDSLATAAERGFDVIDIRTAEEVAERPAAARHIPMQELL